MTRQRAATQEQRAARRAARQAGRDYQHLARLSTAIFERLDRMPVAQRIAKTRALLANAGETEPHHAS